jgi:hypothetical protein
MPNLHLHEEAKQLINSMTTTETPNISLREPSCHGSSVGKELCKASTLHESRRLCLKESTAQEIFVDLVGDYLDEVVKSNDHHQVIKLIPENHTELQICFKWLIFDFARLKQAPHLRSAVFTDGELNSSRLFLSSGFRKSAVAARAAA